MGIGPTKSRKTLISFMLILIGLVLVLAFLWRRKFEQQATLGLFQGVFVGISLPYLGLLLIIIGVLIVSFTMHIGQRRILIIPIMLVGFFLTAFGLVGLIITYYQWFVLKDWLWAIDYYLLQDSVIVGMVNCPVSVSLVSTKYLNILKGFILMTLKNG